MAGLISLGAAGVGAVGDIVSGLFSGHANRRENRRNRQFAHDEAVLAHQRQLEIMDKQNEYNTPAAQRARMQEAGFSPWTMTAGSMAGSATSSGASGGAQANSPSSIPASFGNFGGLMNVLQAKMMESQIARTNAETQQIGTQTEGQSIQNEFQSLSLRLFSKYGELKEVLGMNNMDSQTLLNDSYRYLNNMQVKLAKFDLDNLKPAQAAQLVSQTALNEQEVNFKKLLGAKTVAEKEKIINDIAISSMLCTSTLMVNRAQANYFNSAALLNNANSLLVGAKRDYLGFQKSLQERLWDKNNGPAWISAKNSSDMSTNSLRYQNATIGDALNLHFLKKSFRYQLLKTGELNKRELEWYSDKFFYGVEKVAKVISPFAPAFTGNEFNFSPPTPVNGYNPYTTNFSYEGM